MVIELRLKWQQILQQSERSILFSLGKDLKIHHCCSFHMLRDNCSKQVFCFLFFADFE